MPSSAVQAESTHLDVNVIREPAVTPLTPRKLELCLAFGLPPRESPTTIVEGLRLSLAPETITLISGPSGSGKSSLLRHIASSDENATRVGGRPFPQYCPIVDAIAPREATGTATQILTACGLSEPRLWIRRYCDLSDGEKFRASLAWSIGRAVSSRSRPVILCDEFGATLHDRLARTIALNLRKLVSRYRLTLILAATREDMIDELQPDQIIRLGGGKPVVISCPWDGRPGDVPSGAVISPGRLSDYQSFSQMHYRHRERLGFVDRVFVLRDKPKGAALGIAVFAHAPRELSLRNIATQGRFSCNVRRLNRELRILRRVVIHPDIRGCGWGHWFVKNALPRAGVRFVECLAVMGAVNPVFERAGMTRIGRCPMPAGRAALLSRMRAMKVSPYSPTFAASIARCPRVRELVERTIGDYVESMQSAAPWRINGRTGEELAGAFRQVMGEPPMYYLWDREGEFPCANITTPDHLLCDDDRKRSRGKTDRYDPRQKPPMKTPRQRKSHRPDAA